MFSTNFSSFILDIKTYFLIKFKYPKRFFDSRIESYVFPHTKIGAKVILMKNSLVSPDVQQIGKGTYIGSNSKIFECESIGSFCSIAHNVHIGLSNHPFDHISTNPLLYEKSRGLTSKTTFTEKQNNRTIVGHDVLISSSALIMSGINVGTGSIIGAGSFVNKDVPPYSIVAGSPAKIIKYRFDEETRKKLLDSKWWESSFEDLKKKENYFNNPKEFLNAK